jgi:hypothetical protein
MNIGSVGMSNLATQMRSASASNQSAAASVLKSAMNQPQQFLQLLEQSVSVTNVENIASGMGMNVDSRV